MIKWFDWKSKYNEWRFFFYLNNCLKLVKKYESRQKINFVIIKSKKRNVVVVEESFSTTTSQFIVVTLSTVVEKSFSTIVQQFVDVSLSINTEKNFSQNSSSTKKKRDRFKKTTSWRKKNIYRRNMTLSMMKTINSKYEHDVINIISENVDFSFYLITYWYEQRSLIIEY